ncbi:hypothetical protein ACFL2T_02365 [Elusimicrobiota bacterium]
MTIYLVSLAVLAILLGYNLSFTGATLHMGRQLSGTDEGTGLQDAITPPASSHLAILLYSACLMLIGAGFYFHGILIGGGGALGLFVGATIFKVAACPKPDSDHFRRLILSSMMRRYADYRRDNDESRASALAALLNRAGISVDALESRTRDEGGV